MSGERLVVQRVVSVKVPEDLRELFQKFLDASPGTYRSVGDAFKTLLVRGLFLDEKPSGRLSEPAFDAAFVSFKGELLHIFMRKAGAKLKEILDETYQEVLTRQGRPLV